MPGMLGKLPRVIDDRTLYLENYLTSRDQWPPIPETVDWFAKSGPLSMAGNDNYGDCVVAGAGNMIRVWTGTAGRKVDFVPDPTILQTYFDLTGGGDTGLNMLEFLKFWRKTGFGGHKIGAFMSVNPKNHLSVRMANYLFGGLFCGFLLPASCQKADVWTVPLKGPIGEGEPGSWGGHCVNLGYADAHQYKVGTWGAVQPVSHDFIPIYTDEMYAIVTLEWFTAAHKTPHGLAWSELMRDLALITRDAVQPAVEEPPRWLAVAEGEIGVREWAGSYQNNPRIVEYFKATTYHATKDEVPWCSALVNWVMQQAGIKGSGSAAAVSWLNWGQELSAPRKGCVAVFEWSGGGHHVALYDSPGKYLGGNQADAVNIASMPDSAVIGWRWPNAA